MAIWSQRRSKPGHLRKMDLATFNSTKRSYDNAGSSQPAFSPDHLVLQGRVTTPDLWVEFDPFLDANYEDEFVNAALAVCSWSTHTYVSWRGQSFLVTGVVNRALARLASDCLDRTTDAIKTSHWWEFVIEARGLCFAWWTGQMHQLADDANLVTAREFVEQFRDRARPPEPTDDYRLIAERLRERRAYRSVETAGIASGIEGQSLRTIYLR